MILLNGFTFGNHWASSNLMSANGHHFSLVMAEFIVIGCNAFGTKVKTWSYFELIQRRRSKYDSERKAGPERQGEN